MNGKLIVFEGADGRGKSTQIHEVFHEMKSLGYKVIKIKIPVKNTLTSWLHYFFLKTGLAIMFPGPFQYISFLNKMLFQTFLLPILIWLKYNILLDRWDLSALIYGRASGLCVNTLINTYVPLKIADLTFLFLGRQIDNENGDFYEKDHLFQSKVSYYYEQWAENFADKNDNRAISINPNREISQITKDIMAVIISQFQN